ncbi:adenylate kinase [Nautilia profundicola AmH]|uniref:Adenylate kinase n=1 Tax=Nautilia profundicola (strain ATCC BAA-1463 / DSM 18972 / AmH) TaxID=598659 RepID=KAD_NAUPA|nr:adenylate kinase [Nautilia profundicola]B9L9Y8.1 RecName: Full=Adenylate kinase; Short=AK; AltName: Full=ATP-AMP transphosphorylase; AltName: Full=ATP:AMP phosphotransferase; AltName: Full=Adenylate monophosphate kinase [Nautilia profundicola AmH]ACM92710.1 adenylate kinase [Nautilia profundicola AmH]
MKKLFLIIGAPGSGKTTDAELIAERNSDKIVHYSTGDLLRAEVASGSELGQTIKSYIDNGNLVPLEIVINTIKSAIEKAPKDIVLIDGFPRSVEQMKALDEMLKNTDDIELVSVIEVEVSEDVARERVLGRARGADDNVEVFNNRMKVFTEPLKDIQDFYSAQGKLIKINGERTIEEIVDEMEQVIKEKAGI